MKWFAFIAVIYSFTALTACAPAVQLTQFNQHRSPKPEGCYLEVFSDAVRVNRQYEDLGSISVGDTGFSIDCSQQKVISLIKAGACKAGADAVVIFDVMFPDMWSTCYRAKARFIAYTGPELPSQTPPQPKSNLPVNRISGTCFFIDNFGTAVTNYHVIKGFNNIEVITSKGTKSSANVMKTSDSIDTAILTTGHITSNYLTVASGHELKLGQQVFTIGYPVTSILGDAAKYSEGTISSLSGLNNDDSWIQMSTPVQPGNSGGPLVNEEGQVVGIVTATAAVERFFALTGSLPQNVNWAIKAEYARPLIPNTSEGVRFSDRQAAISHTEKSICRVIAY